MVWTKRLAAPKIWPIERKKFKYAITPLPGSHPKNFCIPLAIIIRDILNYAENLKEAKKIINSGKIKVDGRIVKEYRFPVGLFDVISIEEINEHYRILPNKDGFEIKKIDEKEAKVKIVKVKNKVQVSKDKYQITFHDGKNILTDNNNIKPHDSLLIELPSLKILKHLKFSEGMLGLIIKGENAGKYGKVEKINKGGFNRVWLVEITVDKKIITDRRNVFIIGEKEPLISI